MSGPRPLTDIKQILEEKGAKIKCLHCVKEYITYSFNCYYEQKCHIHQETACTCCEYDTYFILQWEEHNEE